MKTNSPIVATVSNSVPVCSPMRRAYLSRTVTCALLILAAASWVWSQGTDQTAPKGIQAGNSYSISDIETINTTTGNLMLNIPLAKLPAGRGGLSAGISLMYNSKLWDLNIGHYTTACPEENPYCTPFDRELHTLKRSEDGGWRYAIRYEIKYVTVEHTYTGTPPQGQNCSAQLPGGWAKPVVVTPDGAQHELRIQGTRAGDDGHADGSYPFALDGTPLDGPCHADAADRPTTGAVLTYFTIDGSFLRLDVTVGSTPSASSWMLYLPDGSRVTGALVSNSASAQQDERIHDRNGNYLDILRVSNYNSTGYTADVLRDQLNREVAIKYATGPGTPANRDTIVMTGFDGATLEWQVNWKTIYVNQKYDWGYAGSGTFGGHLLQRSQRVVESIDLPTQLGSLDYSFGYNADTNDYQGQSGTTFTADTGWGEVSSVITPLGATAAYEYKRNTPGTTLAAEMVLNNFPVTKTLTYKCEYDSNCKNPDGSSVSAGSNITEVWEYDYDFEDPDATHGWSTVTGPDGGITKQEFHTTGDTVSSPVGQPYRTTNPDGTVIERIWAENKPAATYYGSSDANPYVSMEFTTIKNYGGTATLTAIKGTEYDKNGNTTKVKEYGFVAASSIPRGSDGLPTGAPSGVYPARVNVVAYAAETPAATDNTTSDNDAYYATAGGGYPRFLQAVAWSEVHSVGSGGSEAAVTRVENTYDNALTTGNLTLTRTWDDHKGGSYRSISTPLTDTNSNKVQTTYNSYGMPTSITDANLVVTQITYGYIASGSSVNNLYPTQTVIAYGTGVAKTATAEYDFDTGAVILSTDEDNDVQTVIEYDALARPTLSKAASGTAVEARTAIDYDDDYRRVITRSDLNVAGDGKIVKIQHVDQLGRTRLTRVLENAATEDPTDEADGIKLQTRYGFASGYAYQLASNPYRASSTSGASSEDTMGWTRSKSFTNGNLTETETFDGVTIPLPGASSLVSTGLVVTLRDANKTYVRDQADKWRMSETNALGQLVKVTEDPTSSISGYTHTGTDILTEYSYDTLSNLTGVTMGYSVSGTPYTQTRTFAYSSLSRLLSAANPESGTIEYSYDPNGNLTEREDARGVTTEYTYDELNRPTFRGYSDSTPDVTYAYDSGSVPFGEGRLASVSNGISTTEYTKYDQLGRILASQQTTDGLDVCSGGNPECLMTYKYNLAGQLTQETYPSGRIVHHNYAADGKLTAVSSQLAINKANKSYAQNFSYNATGAVTGMQLGNMRWESTEFNSRLQPTKIALGTTTGDDDLLNLIYGYGTTANNGNVLSQTIKVENVGATAGFEAVQTYTYDEVNRLLSATENNTPNGGSSSQSWKQTYSFDRFGNRNFVTSSGATTTIPGGCSTAVCNPAFNLANNRFAGSQGYLYDNAGNITEDATGKKFIYDAENKQKSFGTGGDDDNGGIYVYDGDGRRVKKIVGTEVTIFVYAAAGQVVAEYATTTPTSPQVNYLTVDTLDTPRINTAADGDVIARHDYMPYGEEIFGSGNRGTGIGYGGDNIRQEFTGYERDEETGLDYAKARMFGSAHGRFTSPDDILNDTYTEDPSSWNRYVYVRNNPLKFVDPSGTEIWIEFFETVTVTDADGNQTQRWEPRYVQYVNGELFNRDGTAYAGDNHYARSVQRDLNLLASVDPFYRMAIRDLQLSNQKHTIGMVTTPGRNRTVPVSGPAMDYGYPTGSIIEYDPNNDESVGGDRYPPPVQLAHELSHAYDLDWGEANRWDELPNGLQRDEVRAVDRQNLVAFALGSAPRFTYSGTVISSADLPLTRMLFTRSKPANDRKPSIVLRNPICSINP